MIKAPGLFDVLYRFKGETESYYRIMNVYTKKEIEEKIKENHKLKDIALKFWDPITKRFREASDENLPVTKTKSGLFVVVEIVSSQKSIYSELCK
jgi:hypothetical protein